MNAKAVVFISCRLLAIYVFVLHVIGFAIETSAALFGDPYLRQDASFLPIIGAMAFGVALYGLVAVFLWSAAGWLSRLIAAPFPEPFGDDIDFHRWQAVIVMALGGVSLMIAAEFGAEVLKQDVNNNPVAGITLRGAIGFAVLGIGMILFSRQIVAGLNRAREWASKPFVKVEEDK